MKLDEKILSEIDRIRNRKALPRVNPTLLFTRKDKTGL